MDTAGKSQSTYSIEETNSIPTTQASTTVVPMETEEDDKGDDEARAKTSATEASGGMQKKQSEGVIDLEKLMNTIDMTRVSVVQASSSSGLIPEQD